MILRKAIEEIDGLRFVVDDLELRSGLSKRVLLETEFMSDPRQVDGELSLVGRMAEALAKEPTAAALENVAVKLERVRDLRGTVEKVKCGLTLDDIELFEIKVFAMTAGAISSLLDGAGFAIVDIPPLGEVVSLLDPDNTGIPHFAVYDSYSQELAEVRRKIKKLKQNGAQPSEVEPLQTENSRLEDCVRERLSAQLQPFGSALAGAMIQVARLDILMAKAAQAGSLGMCRPRIGEGQTRYDGLFNPGVRGALRAEGREFQPVEIAIGDGPTVITGANMGGKTVLLRSVALAQAMAQFGFYVPAAQADVVAVDMIVTAIGDGQDAMSGLSSFAAEMLRLNDMVQQVRAGRKVLALIDEPARTTNPAEGEAIVNSLVDFLAENRVRSLVTSHYGGICARCRRLRVRGFAEEVEPGGVTPQNIQKHMDYSLTEDDGQVPREALRIATILGVDTGLLDSAARYMENNKPK